MEAGGTQDGVLAAPITRAIAGRVRHFRELAGMKGSGLASRLNDHGIGWTRTTVAKFETFKRESITIQEWLALALALGVPPVWLLADPTTGLPVPLTNAPEGKPSVEPDPWAALLWAGGRAPLDERADASWLDAEVPLRQATSIAAVVESYRARATRNEVLSAVVPDDYDKEAADAADRRQLQSLIKPMNWLLDNGYQLPVLPADVVESAQSLGVDLPGQGD